MQFKTIVLIFALLLCFACTDEEKPAGWLPEVTVFEAEEITRNSALLQGEVVAADDVIIQTCEFVCTSATDASDTRRLRVNRAAQITTTIDQLQAGHTYHYYMEVANDVSRMASEPLTFTTLPNVTPTLEGFELLAMGPISAFLTCKMLDDGGLPTETGFRFTEVRSGQRYDVPCPATTEGVFTIKKNDLLTDRTYSVYAYATNAVGETKTEAMELELLSTVHLGEPGMLAEMLEGDGKYTLETLTISGYLNGTDIRTLRTLKLKELNMLDANIVEGGMSYIDSRYTQNNTLGYGMFKDCTTLTTLLLPHTLEVIERNALEGCTGLTSIQIPPLVEEFVPSPGCTGLKEITVSPDNKHLAGVDGVLYNKAETELLFYPLGRLTASFTVPATVKAIGSYAFQYCPVPKVVLPNSVQTLGMAAFHAAALEEIVLSDGIETIPNAAFQDCTGLKRATLGTATALLSEYCFEGCPLTDLYILADYPPIRREEAFKSTDIYEKCTIHVPPGCRSLYRGSASWTDFWRIVDDAE